MLFFSTLNFMACLLIVKNIFIPIPNIYKMWGGILVLAVHFAVRFVPDLSLVESHISLFLISMFFLYI